MILIFLAFLGLWFFFVAFNLYRDISGAGITRILFFPFLLLGLLFVLGFGFVSVGVYGGRWGR